MEEDLEKQYLELFKNNVRLQDNFERIAIGDELQMISPFLEALTCISAAKTMKPGSASLFLSQVFSTVGIDAETSSIGIIGPTIKRMVEKVTEAIKMVSNLTLASEMLLKMIVKGVVIYSIAGGIALKLKGSQGLNEESSKIYVRLILLFVASSEILKKTLVELMGACGSDEKHAEMGAEILAFTSMILVGYVANEGSKDFSALVEVLNRYFGGSLKKMDEMIEKNIAEQKMDAELQAAMHAVISQVALSLEKEESEDFSQAMKNALGLAEIKPEDFDKDILEMKKMIEAVFNALSIDMPEIATSSTQVSVLA